jgi:Undecaprenyl-phosphate glucose phosphotransferase
MLGSLENIYEYLKGNSVHEIYVALPENNHEIVKTLSSYCESNLIRMKIVPDYNGFSHSNNVTVDFYGSIPVISLRKEPLELPINRITKRLFDVMFSLGVIILIFPWLFPILSLLIKSSSKGPIFFKQKRSCENNHIFWCWKFRSMKVNNNANTEQAKRGDARITKIGKFMRKTNLDELPQFFNVFIGEMSVVGPRPHMTIQNDSYKKIIDTYLVRSFIKPGITGWAQVSGFRGETKELALMEKRVLKDIEYLENWTLMFDIRIIFLTIYTTIKGDKNAF